MDTVRLCSAAELVAVLPYEMGFRPRRSVVLVGVRDRRVDVVQRVDVTDDATAISDICAVFVGNLQRDGCQAALIVGYEDRPGESAALGGALASAVRDAGLTLVDEVVVRGGSLVRPGDLGSRAVSLPPDDSVPAVATFVALGRCPAPDRETLAARLKPTDTPLRAAVSRAVEQRGRGRGPRAAAAVGWWAAYLDWTAYPPAEGVAVSAVDMARLILSLRDRRMRDLVIAWLCPGSPPMRLLDAHLVAMATATFRSPVAPRDPEVRGWLSDRLGLLIEHCPEAEAPAVLSVLAALAWFEGRGAVAGLAVERALDIDPTYRLARLLERMVRYGIRPGCEVEADSPATARPEVDDAPLAG